MQVDEGVMYAVVEVDPTISDEMSFPVTLYPSVEAVKSVALPKFIRDYDESGDESRDYQLTDDGRGGWSILPANPDYADIYGDVEEMSVWGYVVAVELGKPFTVTEYSH